VINMTDASKTATSDTTYNLISVTYHALQAVDTYHTYARDAAESGDTQLQGILETAIEAQKQLATRAKELLTARLSEGGKS
jgi:rubrerythrin